MFCAVQAGDTILIPDAAPSTAQLDHVILENQHYYKERFVLGTDLDPGTQKSEATFIYKCLLCSNPQRIYSHPARSKMREHIMASHFNMAPYRCAKCGKRFKHDSSYYRHLKQCKGLVASDEQAEEAFILDEATGTTLHRL